MPGSQGADAMVSMQQWVADTIYDLTGTGHGLVLKSCSLAAIDGFFSWT